MEQRCGDPHQWTLMVRAEDRLQRETWQILASEQHCLLKYSNSLAQERLGEERAVLMRVVRLKRHQKDIRSKLASGQTASKAVALVLKAFRLTRDIEEAEYSALLKAELALGPQPTLPLPPTAALLPERPLRLALTQRGSKPAESRFSRAAAYMRAKRLTSLGELS